MVWSFHIVLLNYGFATDRAVTVFILIQIVSQFGFTLETNIDLVFVSMPTVHSMLNFDLSRYEYWLMVLNVGCYIVLDICIETKQFYLDH